MAKPEHAWYSHFIASKTFRARRPGLTALVTVMVLGGVALFTALVIAIRGAGETDLSLTSLHGAQADALLFGCADEALLRLSKSTGATLLGTTTFTIGNGECEVTTSNSGGSTSYELLISAKRQRSRKAARVRVLLPAMQVVSWEVITVSSSSAP